MPRKPTPPKNTSPKKTGVPAELTDSARGIRLQKAMAEAGVASRRDCEAMVEAGRVTVNGQRVTALPAWVDPAQDHIEVDAHPLPKRKPKSQTRGAHKPVYLLINKPKRVISTADDDLGRTTVLDLIDLPFKQRLFPVGRLDADSTGLMLLTNDGELANRLTHPRYGITKQYRVSVNGRLTEKDLARLHKGLHLAPPPSAPPSAPPESLTPRGTSGFGASTSGASDSGGSTSGGGGGGRSRKKPVAKRAAMEAVRIVRHEIDRARGDRTLLEITLTEGQNREIRRLLARLNIKVRTLDRTAIGPLRLKGVPRAGWRALTPIELGKLKKAAGLK